MRKHSAIDPYPESRDLSNDEGQWASDSEEWSERDPYGDSDLWIADDPWAESNVSESLTLKYLGSQAMPRV